MVPDDGKIIAKKEIAFTIIIFTAIGVLFAFIIFDFLSQKAGAVTSSPLKVHSEAISELDPNDYVAHPDSYKWDWLLSREKYNWNPELAAKIIELESGGDPDRIGDLNSMYLKHTDGCGSVGLFQINAGNLLGKPHEALKDHRMVTPFGKNRSGCKKIREWLKDPMNNFEIAHILWEYNDCQFKDDWYHTYRIAKRVLGIGDNPCLD